MSAIPREAAPVKVLDLSNNGLMYYDVDLFEDIFNDPIVKDRSIVVFSITGAYRNGKSYFLNYCLRFLYANYESIKCPFPIRDACNWIGRDDEPLDGFSWRAGSKRDTLGILMWNDVFLHTKDGQDIAIVVFDMQGLFDTKTSFENNTKISALGNLLSSIQIINSTNVIQQNLLEYFHFVTEFSKFSSNCGHEDKMFQNLMFLLRDWKNSAEYDYGIEGGNEYLEGIMEDNHDEKLNSTIKFIKNSFEKLECALLPYPGEKVAIYEKDSIYNGNCGEMSPKFKTKMTEVIEHVLKPENLVLKKIHGNNIKVSSFMDYMVEIFRLFESDELPKPKTIHEAMTEQFMRGVVDSCIETFKRSLTEMESTARTVEQARELHNKSYEEAMVIFENSKKFGDGKKFEIVLKNAMKALLVESLTRLQQKMNNEQGWKEFFTGLVIGGVAVGSVVVLGPLETALTLAGFLGFR